MADACLPESPDAPRAILLARGHAGASADIQGWLLDIAQAYNHVGVAADQFDFATAMLAGPAGAPRMESLRANSSVSRRAPAAWYRAAAFLQYATRRVCRIWRGIYVEDCFSPGSVAKIQSAFLTTMAVCADHGLSLEQKKEAPPSHSMLLLGDRADIRGHRVPVELATARRNEYRDTAQPPLLSWRMPPPQAAKMRAELTYAQSMCSAVLEVRRSTIARRVSAHRQAGRC